MNATEMKNTVVDTVTRTSKDVLMAGLGVVATLEEQGRQTFETLVEKGKKFEATDRTTISKTFQDARGRVKDFGKRLEDGVTGTTEAVLHRFGMPSHAEVQALIARVEQLTAKVEALGKK